MRTLLILILSLIVMLTSSNFGGQIESTVSIWWNCELIISEILVSKWLLGGASHSSIANAVDFPDLQDLDTGFSLTTSYQSSQSLLSRDPGLCSYPHYVQTSMERMRPSSWCWGLIIYRMDVSSPLTIIKRSWTFSPILVCAVKTSTEGIRPSSWGWGLSSTGWVCPAATST